MSRYLCDLHIHSCLSPCGDDDMTPGNIAGMAVLNGLQIVALTDHNSSKNCPAFFKIAKRTNKKQQNLTLHSIPFTIINKEA